MNRMRELYSLFHKKEEVKLIFVLKGGGVVNC